MERRELVVERVHTYYWENDFSCAEVSQRILNELFKANLPTQLLWATFALNAGRCGLQCGLVEGPLLFMGIYAAKKHIDQGEIRKLCRRYCAEFTAEFGSMLCSELRSEGFKRTNPPHLCEARTVEAVVFAIEFIEKHM